MHEGRAVNLKIRLFSYIFVTWISRLIFHVTSRNLQYIFMNVIQREACLSFFYLGPSFYFMQSRK